MSFMTITKVFSWRPLATVSQLLKAVGGRTHLIWELALDKRAQHNRHIFLILWFTEFMMSILTTFLCLLKQLPGLRCVRQVD